MARLCFTKEKKKIDYYSYLKEFDEYYKHCNRVKLLEL